MWKKDETPKAPPSAAPAERQPVASAPHGGQALVGNSLVVEGSIRGNEDLLVEGRVIGDITLPENTVTVGESGNVEATINARVIVVEGRVEGDLVGGEQIEIRRSGNVLGNITSPRVGLEDGAQFKGNIDMSPKAKKAPAPTPTPAPAAATLKDEPVSKKAADTKLPG